MAKKVLTPKKKEQKVIEVIKIPSGIEFSLEGNMIKAKKGNKQLLVRVPREVIIKIEGEKIEMTAIRGRKAERREVGTMFAHVNNMVAGLENGFEYELEICNVHFPITVLYDKVKKLFSIKNVLGEKTPRTINSFGDVEVEIKAPKIKISSYDLTAAGQTAANLEKVTRIRNRDRNKFQDGIFITKKPGVEY
jgi:large subunit ribosomal protein L6